MDLPERRGVLGLPVSMTSYQELMEVIDRRPSGEALCVAFCNVHSVMTARKEPRVAETLRSFEVAAPDGMPLVWALRRSALRQQRRVYGPDFMELALREGVARGWRHYFCGATEETLQGLESAAARLAPGARIVGCHAPPFAPVGQLGDATALARIRAADPDLVWFGLGMPKQELWMRRLRGQLPGKALLGVGAAFDFLSGNVVMAPDWAQDRGLEWAYRLWRDPRRLWRRYLFNNSAFLLLLARDLVIERLPHRAKVS